MAVACSAGADSLALLHVIYQLRAEYDLKLYCLHFDHRWFITSQQAVDMLREYCQRWQIQLILGQSTTEGPSSEDQARQERYAFFAEACQKHACKQLYLAHHKEDLLETLLFRMLRGSGPEGLMCMQECMAWQGRYLLRPFLALCKSDLLEYCQSQQLEYYTDRSNEDISLKRNYIRHKVIPALSEVNAGFEDHLLNLQQLITGQYDFLQTRKARELQGRKMPELHTALQRELLKDALQEYGVPVSFALIEKLRKCLLSGKEHKINIAQGIFFRCQEFDFALWREY